MKAASTLRRNISIKQLNRIFGSLTVRNITARDRDEWLIKRGKTISASCYNNERDTLRQLFEFARRDGLILDNPADHVRRRKLTRAAIVIPTKEQFGLLVRTIRDSDERAKARADLVEFLASSGTRLREATSLLWTDVDFTRGCFTVRG
jgi:site-specific recombinase XerD